MNRHKVVASEAQVDQEHAQQAAQREARVQEFAEFWRALEGNLHGDASRARWRGFAARMHSRPASCGAGKRQLRALVGPVITAPRAPARQAHSL